MFDSVLDRGVAPRRRLATGAVVSVFGHAAVLSAALMIRPPTPAEAEAPTPGPVVILARKFIEKAAPGAVREGGGAGARAIGPKPRRSRDRVAPTSVPKDIDLTPPPDEPITGGRIGNPTPDTEPTGLGAGTGPAGGGGPPDSTGTCSGPRCDVDGMNAPVLLERGREPDYTREALEAHVQGMMTIQCIIPLEGRPRDCQVIQPLPHMERAVVEALGTRRYAPATWHGRPLAVRYVFRVKLQMPQ